MTKEQKKALIRIFKRQAKFFADMPAITSLIDTYADMKTVPPKDWRKRHLAELQNSDRYRAILAEFEPAIAKLESSLDDDALIALCEKMSRNKLPN